MPKAGPLGALAVAVCACAMQIQPAHLGSHLEWRLDPIRASEARLGIGRFVDARSPEDRRGQHPPLRVVWLGLAREGENRTGDAAFHGDLAQAAREDAAATLRYAGAYASVRLIRFDGPEAWPEGIDEVLVARIERFEGLQHQRLLISPLQIGWLRNRFEPASGRSLVRYQLYQPDGRSTEYRIAAEALAPEAGIAQAAVDALAMANEELAVRLRARSGASLTRWEVPVHLVDYCALGRARASRVLAAASELLRGEVGIALRGVYEARPTDGTQTLAEVLADVRTISPPDDGLVLGVAPGASSRGLVSSEEMRFGLAHPFGRHAVVVCSPQREVNRSALVHEIAHLLGAIHVSTRSSIMNAVGEFEARFFDPLNRRILRSFVLDPFRRPIPEDTARRLRGLYEGFDSDPRVQTADLAGVRRALEQHAER